MPPLVLVLRCGLFESVSVPFFLTGLAGDNFRRKLSEEEYGIELVFGLDIFLAPSPFLIEFDDSMPPSTIAAPVLQVRNAGDEPVSSDLLFLTYAGSPVLFRFVFTGWAAVVKGRTVSAAAGSAPVPLGLGVLGGEDCVISTVSNLPSGEYILGSALDGEKAGFPGDASASRFRRSSFK
jgi:hypothetical protein